MRVIALDFKAALINNFLFKLIKAITCKVKGSLEEKNRPTLQILSALWSILAPFSLLFWFYIPQLYRTGSVSLKEHQPFFLLQQAAEFSQKML